MESRLEKVVVVGQGYVGLPLAMRAVEVGFDVVGFDVDDDRVKRLAAGESYVEDVSGRRGRRPPSPPVATTRRPTSAPVPGSTWP